MGSDAPRVAYQGEPGAYSEMAARRCGGTPLPCRTFGDAVAAVAREECDYAVLPLENSLGGALTECLDLFHEQELVIHADLVLPIHHRLMGLPGATIQQARTVQSHPQALAQCRTFLGANAHLKPVASYDTAGSAREVREAADPTRLAVCSALAGQIHGLVELASPVPPREMNLTRFAVCGRAGEAAPSWAPRPARRTALACILKHQPGALVEALECFSRRGINLARLEARPATGQPFEYVFHLELEVAGDHLTCMEALQQLRALGSVKLYGSFGRLEPAIG